jgi:hypothetical protein
MIKSVFAIVVMLISSLVAAQDGKTTSPQKFKPDLSGTWILESTEDRKGKSIVATNEVLLVVTHLDPKIRFLDHAGSDLEEELVYYSDGRGEENRSGLSISTVSRSSDSAQ